MGVTVSKFPSDHNPCIGEMSLDEIPNPQGSTNNNPQKYDFDLIIVGGGSGGLAAAKAAAKLKKRVGLCDYVKPSPNGSSWGLGGTCVNVGCIPKKLMHQAALLGQSIEDSTFFGWLTEGRKDTSHDWDKMVKAIQSYIQSLNWGYKVTLSKDGVEYYNAYAHFLDSHTIQLKDDRRSGETFTLTSETFIICTGGRPKYLDDIEGGGAGQGCITSDDIFSLGRNPGKVLVVGGSYVGLECAGFLAGLGYDTTILIRSILLRGFDQQMANLVGEVLSDHEVKLLKGWLPTKIEEISNPEESESGLPEYLVTYENLETNEQEEDVFNTIILAVGRDPCTKDLSLENAGVDVNPDTGKILTNPSEQTSAWNIFAIGDVAEERPELTPVAIQSAVYLIKRLYGGGGPDHLVDYKFIPTTVFTPLEYGCVGYPEEDAIQEFGQDNIEVYHQVKQPLEFSLPARDKKHCYSKLVCLKSENERVLGFHYLGPNAGEITQGFALAVRMKATKADFDGCIGIHPTCAELFTTLTVTKASGAEWRKTNC